MRPLIIITSPVWVPVARWLTRGWYVLLLLLVIGCTRAQDNGFLTGCDTPSGEVDLDGECYDVTWPSVPLTLYANGEREALERAVERWERRRPFQHQDLFEILPPTSPTPVTADVTVNARVTAPAGSDVLGDTRFYHFGGRLTSDVRVFRTAFASQTECIIFHELGHVLGLAHDDFGPMRVDACALECDPGDIECIDDTLNLVDVRVTDGDHRRLNDVY